MAGRRRLRVDPTFVAAWLLLAVAVLLGRVGGYSGAALVFAILAATVFIARLTRRYAFRRLEVETASRPTERKASNEAPSAR